MYSAVEDMASSKRVPTSSVSAHERALDQDIFALNGNCRPSAATPAFILMLKYIHKKQNKKTNSQKHSKYHCKLYY